MTPTMPLTCILSPPRRPLLWSIVAFRNSLVFHSLDMLTSHFLHLYPACVSWSQRWAPPPVLAARLAASPKDAAAWDAANFWELALLPMLPYALWVVAYYIKVLRWVLGAHYCCSATPARSLNPGGFHLSTCCAH